MSVILTDTLKARVVGAAVTTEKGLNVGGACTATSFVGNVTGNASGTAGGLTGTPDITIRNVTGVAATFTGVLTYEDVTNVDSVGIVTARGGFEIGASGVGGTITAVGNAEFAGITTIGSDLSIADKIIHTGDTNTAIRFPAADTITAETSGSERLRISSAGVISVATTSSSSSNLTIHSSNTGSGGIYFNDGANTGSLIYDHNSNYMGFRVSGAECGRFDVSGKLLLKTQSLTNIANDADDLVIGSYNSSTERGITLAGTVAQSIRFNDGADAGSFEYDHGTNSMRIITSASERLRIDSSGRVGIATVDPSTLFSSARALVVGGGSGSTGITIFSGTTGSGNIEFADGNASDAVRTAGGIRYYHDGNYMRFNTNDGSERLRITSNGGFSFNNGELVERVKITADKLSNAPNIDLENGMVHYFSTQETTTATPNIRVNSSTSLNSVMETGDTAAVTIVIEAAAAGYYAQLTIDGNTISEQWVGGSAPSAGGADGYDVYTYTILKLGNNNWLVFANLTNAT